MAGKSEFKKLNDSILSRVAGGFLITEPSDFGEDTENVKKSEITTENATSTPVKSDYSINKALDVNNFNKEE